MNDAHGLPVAPWTTDGQGVITQGVGRGTRVVAYTDDLTVVERIPGRFYTAFSRSGPVAGVSIYDFHSRSSLGRWLNKQPSVVRLHGKGGRRNPDTSCPSCGKAIEGQYNPGQYKCQGCGAMVEVVGGSRRNPISYTPAEWLSELSKRGIKTGVAVRHSNSVFYVRAIKYRSRDGGELRLSSSKTGALTDPWTFFVYPDLDTLDRLTVLGAESKNPGVDDFTLLNQPNDAGRYYIVRVSSTRVREFKRGWPGSNIAAKPYRFSIEKGSGDLVDIEPRPRGDAWVEAGALASDANNWLADKFGLPQSFRR